MAKDIGIDLGTTKIVIYDRSKGMILDDPCVIAKDTESGKAIKYGAEAYEMMGRTPRQIVTIRPVRSGVINRYTETLKMVQYYLRRLCVGAVMKPRIIVGVPYGVTEVERQAAFDAMIAAGAKRVYVVEEPLLAALGCDLDISQPRGRMVIDIGGGTTNVAVISMGKIVVGTCLRVGGDAMDDALIRYLRRTYNLTVGERTAQLIKQSIGTICSDDTVQCLAKGICTIEGLPKSVMLSNADLKEALEEPCMDIVSAVSRVLEETPAELLADIQQDGMTLCGGVSALKGLDTLLSRSSGYRVHVVENGAYCVALGTKYFWNYTDPLRRTRLTSERKETVMQ